MLLKLNISKSIFELTSWEYPVPVAAENVLVFVENVFQISTTNYTLEQNPSGYAAGWYVVFGTAVPTGKPVTVLHNFDK